jgi:glycosyltransferase involved in cell wall biosynthesis
MPSLSQTVVILSGAYDDQYRKTRHDNPVICTSAGKRIVLYRAIEEAVGSPVRLLSPQPRGRGKAEALPETTSRFGAQTQLFSKASGLRKIRFLLDYFHYARHVAQHTRTGDTLVIDNYELIYISALYYCRLLGRKNRVLLEYEDGKHLIDKGIWKWISGLAEWLGRPLVEGAILATPTLGERLPDDIPKVCVPGILKTRIQMNPPPPPGQPVCFLYSGSLDYERGIPLLLDYLESGEFPAGSHFHITGQGHFTERLLAVQNRFPQNVHFHGIVSQDELMNIRRLCHYGLNLQSSSNPISNVTFPSKTFDYLNAGLRVISTHAAGVSEILGEAAIYMEKETPAALAEVINQATQALRYHDVAQINSISELFTFDGTVERLYAIFHSHSILKGVVTN